MYTSFIRPQLEYASVVWGGCHILILNSQRNYNCTQPEMLLVYLFLLLENLYFETGWKPLNARRKIQRLNIMYEIHKNLVPEYLSDIVPDMRCNASIYYTRNSPNYIIPVCRLKIYKSSFVPTVVKKWNSLPLDIRDSCSLSLFKNKISKSLAVAPSYFSYGKRRTIFYTQDSVRIVH